MTRALAVLASMFVGCALSHEREVGGMVIEGDGSSDVVSFDVPEGTVSITVVVQGADEPTFALSSFVLSDGIEHFTGVDPLALDSAHGSIGEGAERQRPARGTFTFQYPTIASQALPPGPATLRVASSVPGAPVTVRVITPDTLGSTLHVSIVSFTQPLDVEAEAFSRVQDIFASAGIAVVLDERIELPVREMIAGPDSEMRPSDRYAPLVAEAQAALSTNALPIILVELSDHNGFSRGIPCPPDTASYYHAVFVDPTTEWPDPPRAVSRLVVHELVHGLGLPHVVDIFPGGHDVLDPFDDTTGFDTTVMGSVLVGAPIPDQAMTITPQQAFAIRHSALLE